MAVAEYRARKKAKAEGRTLPGMPGHVEAKAAAPSPQPKPQPSPTKPPRFGSKSSA
jgi:hypothetical protein